HAREHLVDLCKLLFDRDLRRLNRYKDRWWDELDEGNIEALVEQARSFLPKDDNAGKDARREIGYFEKNKERMRYAHFKEQGMFVGSGVIEAGCKTIVAQRLKQSAMQWTVRGANAIIALRCAELSRRTEDYWVQRTA
ncbi:MAG: ISKra4 family transposase, partial [Phycisphaerae bacterium]|nr:ISKra4 family transposase [Phycisphaerae bacterium]